MDMMSIRRALMGEHVFTIGGLPVIYNNAAYKNSNGRVDDVLTDSRFFITGIYDTGDSTSKSYTFTRYAAYIDNKATCFRLYNDLTASSYDFWSISSTGGTRTLSTAGRYILFTVYKPEAADMYMYNNTAGLYVFKGKNVA